MEFDAAANARRPGSDEDEAAISETWSAKKRAHPRLFNGTKFRWAGWVHDCGIATIRLGLTSYRAFQGTNASKNALSLVRAGLSRLRDPDACVSNAVGIGMVVLTEDDQILFIRRSEHVGEARGLVDVVGGHAEPSAAGLAPARFDDTDAPGPGWEPHPRLRPVGVGPDAGEGAACSAGAAAVRELFSSPLDEVAEELNLPRAALGRPRLLGLARNYTTGGRVAAAYACEARLRGRRGAGWQPRDPWGKPGAGGRETAGP